MYSLVFTLFCFVLFCFSMVLAATDKHPCLLQISVSSSTLVYLQVPPNLLCLMFKNKYDGTSIDLFSEHLHLLLFEMFFQQARSDILGYTLGILSFVIACTSRFPTLHRGHTLPRAHAVSVVMRSLSGAFYAAAILLSDTHYAFLLRVMPWLLSAVSGIILDLLVSFCRTINTLYSLTLSSQMKSFLKATDMGRYIDVIAQPVRKICLKEISVSKETEDRSANGVERLIRVDSFYSDTSLDSSTVGSDLEVRTGTEKIKKRKPLQELKRKKTSARIKKIYLKDLNEYSWLSGIS
uniref:Transmembrane protein 44 n=1 Tax=Sphaeramia orbicularis TaxID=375764 RepID=A0A673CHW6_9TELE